MKVCFDTMNSTCCATDSYQAEHGKSRARGLH